MDMVTPSSNETRLRTLIEKVSDCGEMIFSLKILVDFFDGDYVAAKLLHQIIYWTDRSTDTDGWFYKRHEDWWSEIRLTAYQIRRVLRGDNRVKQKDQKTLHSLGLETVVKMAPNGRNATYYRLNVPSFMTEFTEWLNAHSHGEEELELSEHCEKRWGPPTSRIQLALDEQFDRLGNDLAETVLQRCLDAGGNTWKYALAALRNESAPLPPAHTFQPEPRQQDVTLDWDAGQHSSVNAPEPQLSEIPASNSIEQIWPENVTNLPDRSLRQIIETEIEQLKLAFRHQLPKYVEQAHFVDFSLETMTLTFAVPAIQPTDFNPRIERDIRRAFHCALKFDKDQELALEFLTSEEWLTRWAE